MTVTDGLGDGDNRGGTRAKRVGLRLVADGAGEPLRLDRRASATPIACVLAASASPVMRVKFA